MPNTEIGPTTKGSRYCLQRCVNLKPDDLGDRIISASPAVLS